MNGNFDIKPFHYQNEILEKLEVERSVHNRYRNLLVAATGTGKTVISAFDYKNFRSINKSSKLLFVAHRKEILQQAKATFQGVLKDNNFGDFWVDGMEPNSNEYVFASVQTLNNRLKDITLTPEYYDFIIVDEVHHIHPQWHFIDARSVHMTGQTNHPRSAILRRPQIGEPFAALPQDLRHRGKRLDVV